MKEAYLYTSNGPVCTCYACRFICKIADGETGRCGVKRNNGGKLYALNYGLLAAYRRETSENASPLIQPGGINILALCAFGCNFHCPWCCNKGKFEADKLNKGKIIVSDYVKDLLYTHPATIFTIFGPAQYSPKELIKTDLPVIGFNYSEPAVCLEYLYDTAISAKKAGKKIEVHTNGYMTKIAWNFILPHVDFISISVKCGGSDAFYQSMGASFDQVLDSIEHVASRTHLTLFVVVPPGEKSPNMEKVLSLAERYNIDLLVLPLISKAGTVPDKDIVEILEESMWRGIWAHSYTPWEGKSSLFELNTVCPKCGTVLFKRRLRVGLFNYDIESNFEDLPDKCQCGESIPWRYI